LETLLIALIAAAASLLTFFSGFGLGTLLLPIFILFYPVELAVALTAIAHFLNGIFKFGLMRAHVNRQVVLHFGIPALLFAFAGAAALVYLSSDPVKISYSFFSTQLSTTPVKLVIGSLLLLFAIFEILPFRQRGWSGNHWLWLGGILSGFFGGLSGHQGALRSAFLIRLGMVKESFIATGIVIALLIDITRLPVYLGEFDYHRIIAAWPVILVATLSAFSGAYAGKYFLKKVTLHFVQILVAIAVTGIGVVLGMGLV